MNSNASLAEARNGRGGAWPAALAAVGIALAAHASALGNGFVNYDDPQAWEFAGTKSPWEILTGITYYAYKPIYFLSLWLDRAVFGDGPVAPHVVSWLLFAACAGLIVAVISGMTRSAWIGGAAGVLFAVHPVHVENVAWVAERKDVLSLALALGAHLMYRRCRALAPTRVSFAALALFLLAGLSKGSVWTYAGVIALDEWIESPRLAGAARRLSPILALALLGIAADAWIGASYGPGSVGHDATTLQLVAAMAGVHLRYLTHLVWPFGLSVDYAIDPAGSFSDPWAIAGVAFTIAVVAVFAWGLRGRRIVPVLAAGIWILGLAPFNNVWPQTTTLLADRYLLIPALGLYVAFAALLARPALASSRGAVLGVLAAALGVGAGLRGLVYADSETMWTNALETQPTSAVAWISRGIAEQERGEWTSAERDATRGIEAAAALRIPVLRMKALAVRSLARLQRAAQVGDEAARRAMTEDALRDANEASTSAGLLGVNPYLREDPKFWIATAHARRGQALLAMGEEAEALKAFEDGARADPDNFEAQFNLGNRLALERDPARLTAAAEALSRAHQSLPRDLGTVLRWIPILYVLHRDAEAGAAFEEALSRHGRANRDLLLLRARLNVEGGGNVAQAVADYRTILEANPRDADARRALSGLHRGEGRRRLEEWRTSKKKESLTAALKDFERAVEVDPTVAESHWLAADTLVSLERFHEARAKYREAEAAAPKARWLVAQEARAGVLEALGLLQREKDAEAAAVMASVVRRSPPRLDLGFFSMVGEIAALVPAAEAVEEGTSSDVSLAVLLLSATARLVGGDETAAREALNRAVGMFGTPPPAKSRAETLLDTAYILRGLVRARRPDEGGLGGARNDLLAAARRRPDDPLVKYHLLVLDRTEATARGRIAAGAKDEAGLAAVAKQMAGVLDGAHRLADLGPPWPGPLLLAAELDIEQGDFIAALQRLNNAATTFPDDPAIFRGRAYVYVKQVLDGADGRGLLPQARAELKAAKELDPRDLRAALDLSQICQLEGDLGGALWNARIAASLEAIPGAAARRVGALLVDGGRKAMEKHDADKVLQAVEAARFADPNSAGPDVLEGDLWMGKQDYVKALASYEAALAKEPTSREVIHALSECRRKRGFAFYVWLLSHPKPAATAKGTVPADPKRVAQWQEAVMPRSRSAIAELEAALKLEASIKTSEAATEDEEDARKKTLEWIATFRALDPEAQQRSLDAAAALFAEGEALRAKDKVAQALAKYREAIAAFSDHLPARVRVAEILTTLGDDTDALNALDAASELDANGRYPVLDLLRGEVYVRRWRTTKDLGSSRLGREALERFLEAPGGAADKENAALAKRLLEMLRPPLPPPPPPPASPTVPK